MEEDLEKLEQTINLDWLLSGKKITTSDIKRYFRVNKLAYSSITTKSALLH